MLIIMGGLPGVGKTTLSRLLANRLSAVWLRIDSIEQTLVHGGKLTMEQMGGSGYEIACALAADNLRVNNWVIADSVNPIAVTRQAWRDVAVQNAVPYFEIEIVCTNPVIHRARVEGRRADIAGHQLPDWEQVINREYAPWPQATLQVDTALYTPEQAVDMIVHALDGCGVQR